MKLTSTIKVIAFASSVSLAYQSAFAAKVQQTFYYDAAGRLTDVMTDSGQAEASLNEHYVFDASGNITEKVVDGQTVRMTYDVGNQLMSRTDAAGTVHFVYDSAGRLVSEHMHGQTIAQYKYGYLDKVTQVTRGSEVTQFHYNARGMLVAKERNGQIIETFGWDGIGLIAKNETVYANESHVSGGVPLAAIDALDSTADLQYYDSDYLGTTTAVYSAEGDVEAKLVGSYGAYSESDELRFTGKPYDVDLDAHVFPYRNYRADVGRWASADPAGFPDGPNQHYYAAVPTMGLDPLGLAILGQGNLSAAGQDALDNVMNSNYGQDEDSALNHISSSSTDHIFIEEGTTNQYDPNTRTVTFNPNDPVLVTIDPDGESPSQTNASIESIIVHEVRHAFDHITNNENYQDWYDIDGEMGSNLREDHAMIEANEYRLSVGEDIRVWYGNLQDYLAEL